ncbi:MAG: zf-HC2 domain-containing protein [Clostridia bacterium]|nr:zf-HC2 domain-containing protein [Clostridia bacterium]
MTMKLPCAVVRDLLPLYAEKLTEDETKEMVDEHLQECAECRQRLAETDTRMATPIDSSKTLMALKKEIRKRRWFFAIAAALLVFVAVYTFFYHDSKFELVPWQNGLIEVKGIETRPYSEVFEGEVPSAPSETTIDVLVIQYDGIINGIQMSSFKDDDGTETEILQGWSSQGRRSLIKDYSEMIMYPVPDRLIYSVGSQHQLLWGKPMNGGVEVLPRLALAYYICIAAGLALIAGGAWFFLRKRDGSWIPRQVFFAPVSYLAAHFLIKGASTVTFFMERDFISIIMIAAALYALFSVGWQIWLQRKKGV